VRLTDARAHEAGDPRGSADEIGDAPGRHEKMGRGSLGVWNHVVRLARASAVLVLFLAAGCGPEPTGAAETPRPPAESPTRAPDHAELAFVEVPSAIRLNGRFRVVVELRDGAAVATTDHESRVTISASGPGTLGGTLVQMAASGRVVFDDLSYDRWAPITLTVAAEGRRSASTSVPIPVRPLLRFVRRPPNRFVVGEDAGKFEIELVDGAGRAVKSDQPLRLALDPEEADVADGPERPLAAGPATFASLRFKTAGQKSLVWTCPGVADLLHGVIVYAEQRERGQWLPAARVGVPYRAMLEPAGAEFRLVRGALPKGLSFERGAVEGVPTTSQYARFEVLATVEGESPWLSRVELPIYPAREPVLPPLDDLGPPGPHAVETLDATVTIRARSGKALLRAFHPVRAAGAAEGAFPLVVFQHGAGLIDAARPRLYDQCDHLLKHWASHGFVVVTIDGTDLVWEDRRWVPATLDNLESMAENLRAAISYVVRRNGDPKSPLHHRVDAARIVVAGHSRGAAAALIVARTDPRVVGGVLIKPFDPANTVGGEPVWTGPLPPKPLLVVSAGNDGDVPYPIPDFLFERRAAPMAQVTILGSLHYFTVAPGGPQATEDEPSVAEIERREDWDVTDAYVTAFLKYAALGDLDAGLRLFGGAATASKLSSGGVLLQSDRRADAVRIDDFQDDDPARNLFDLPNRDEGMTVSADEPWLVAAIRTFREEFRRVYSPRYQRPDILAASSAHRLEWRLGQASYRLELPDLDVKSRASFAMRARAAAGRADESQIRIAFIDGAGRTASVPMKGHVGAAGLRSRFADVIVPLSEIAPTGIDLENLAAVEIVADGVGSILIDDLRFE
jgi:dienelactone hydrolase